MCDFDREYPLDRDRRAAAALDEATELATEEVQTEFARADYLFACASAAILAWQEAADAALSSYGYRLVDSDLQQLLWSFSDARRDWSDLTRDLIAGRARELGGDLE